jgi:hypothetical protein
MNSTNSVNDLETPGEQELARRLRDLASTTTVSADAWDRLAARTVADPTASSTSSSSGSPSGSPSPGLPGFARRHVRPLLAAAAAVAALVGLAVALGADSDDDNLRTTDHSEDSTTTTERERSADRRSSSTTTSPSTTAPSDDGPSREAAPGAGTTPSSETDGDGQAGGEVGAPSGPGGTESSESERAAPTRAAPTMTLRSSQYTVEIIADPEPGLYFRRTDDVGSDIAGPDGYGAGSHSGWSSQSGPRCLTSGGGTMTYPDAAPHAFTYGLVGSEITRVEVVMPNGATAAATIGPNVGGGFRAWLVERPTGNTVQEIRGLDVAGNVVASIGQLAGDDFGYSVPTC